MWAFCEVPGRHVSLSLQVGAGETRSDFTGAKVRPPSWGHSGPRLFPNPHPPQPPACPSTLQQHLVAVANPPLRGGLPVFPGGRKMPVPRGLAQSSLQQRHPCQGGFPAHSWQAGAAHPAASYMWAPFVGAGWGTALGWLWGLGLNVST